MNERTRRAPTASAVSRFLGQKFFRSEREGRGPASHGFIVQRGYGHAVRPVDWVSVEFEPGPWARSRYAERPDLLRDLINRSLSLYREHLEQRYDVTTNDDGSGEWDTLLVRLKGDE